MAAPLADVVLDRRVPLIDDAPAADTREIREEEEAIGGATNVALGGTDWLLPVIRIVPRLADPPEISTISLQLSTTRAVRTHHLQLARAMSADKNLLVLYLGPFSARPGKEGFYLVYDAIKNSLSSIPRIAWRELSSPNSVGRSTIIKCLGGEGAYVLADLVATFPVILDDDYPYRINYSLCLWWSSSERWVHKDAHLPRRLLDYHAFSVDTSFSFGGSYVCWVDLFLGVLICDVLAARDSEPKSLFVPLPDGYLVHRPRCGRGRVDVFRTAACVNGDVKFLSMDGYLERRADSITVTVWTLVPELNEWRRDERLTVRLTDLWAGEIYKSERLSLRAPRCPVLSTREDGIAYFFLNDSYIVDEVLEIRAAFMLRVDMMQKKVTSCSMLPRAPETKLLFPLLFSTEFCAYLHDSEAHNS